MAEKKENKAVLYVLIERVQHDALRHIAYVEKRSVADVVREALDDHIACALEEL